MIAALLFAAAQVVTAQPSPAEGGSMPLSTATAVAREPGSNLTVYLLTMGPGDQVWEKFGHNAIWIRDADAGTDIVYHWGLFDFADADFVPRFIQGRMRYSMGAFDMEQTIDQYRQTNRTVWAQELNLTPAQRLRLADFVAWNNLPQNRHYDYDYYRDNCSTRVRDAIDGALGGIIESASTRLGTGTTYRFHTSRLTQDDLPIFTGTMIGLGQPVDREISAWEEMFLPVRMKERLKEIRVATPNGSEPLVRGETILFQASRPLEEVTVNRGIGGYLAIAAGFVAAVMLLWFLPLGGAGKTGALVVVTLWSVIAGVAGTLLAFLWSFTDHIYSYRNENLFQLNPVSLIAAAFIVRLVWKRRGEAATSAAALRDARRVTLGVALISVAGFLLQIMPGLDQVNSSVIALAMPLHIGAAALLYLIGRPPRESF
ncbi:MAG: Lnb N-terminal periplasmic domain-containing protein [Gemmatimonadaceae bacterium]